MRFIVESTDIMNQNPIKSISFILLLLVCFVNPVSRIHAEEEDERSGWIYEDPDWFYYSEGKAITGWQSIDNEIYFFNEDGTMKTGWYSENGVWYYLRPSGKRHTGWLQVDNDWYYMNPDGTMRTGWLEQEGHWYYLRPSGKMHTGWIQVDKEWYYLNAKGIMKTGWLKANGKWYYLRASGKMSTSTWVDNGKYYVNKYGVWVPNEWVENAKGWWYRYGDGSFPKSVWKTIEGKTYHFDQSGYMDADAWIEGKYVDGSGKWVENYQYQLDIGEFLVTAMKPMGTTLYVWGGGWDVTDTKAGEGALYSGVYPYWSTYFYAHRQGYSYKPGQKSWFNGERKWRTYGLDCSGYVGWTIYNSMQKNRRSEGYVYKSTTMASRLAGLGLGKTSTATASGKVLPGDIISMKGHVFIVLGKCSDGSVLLAQSTPNGGVVVSGTSGAHGNKAAALARNFMQTHYPDWWSSFSGEGTYSASESTYMSGTRFSWSLGSSICDQAGVRNMSGEEVLKYLEEKL